MEQDTGTLPSSVQVAVIGAGLAGLTCARALARAGKDVHLFEAGPGIGGRMRTEIHPEGFRLDLGFHAFLTGFPAVKREIDLKKLDVRLFDAGCVLSKGGKLFPVSDTLEAARFPFASWGDKLRLRSLRSADPKRIPNSTTMEHLRSLGISRNLIDSFFVPFFGGIFLDRSLSDSAQYFASIVKTLMAAPAGIPRGGIGAVPAQVAEQIPAGAIHIDCPVEALQIEGGRASALTIAGQEVRAEKIVLASGPSDAARLTGLDLPALEMRGMTVVYFAAKSPPTEERRLIIRADAQGWTNHFVVLTHVAPELAPAGGHLLAGVILGTPDLTDGAISELVRNEMAWWFPHGMTHTWRWLRTIKIAAAQWAFPPGLAGRLPKTRVGIDGLLLAGDFTREPSVEGAIQSGIDAAEAVLSG